MIISFLKKNKNKILLFTSISVVLLFLITIIGALGTANTPMRDDKFHEWGNSDSLVVIVPGFKGKAERMDSVRHVVQDKLPNADILIPQFAGGPFSNADPILIAEAIEAKISQKYQTKKYEKIILVGYSAGALLLRKAYICALGQEEDRTGTGSKIITWVDRVDRIILLAGMNRGWTFSPKPKQMNPFAQFAYRLGVLWNEITGTGKFFRNLERGSPFVSDLRVQWIRQSRKDKSTIKPVIQLLGNIDDLVDKKDNKDISVSKDFIFITVYGNTTHSRIVEMGDSKKMSQDQMERQKKFQEALTKEFKVSKEKYKKELPDKEEETEVKQVIFVAHGIRDFATDWMNEFNEEIKSRNKELNKEYYKYEPMKYKYFPMGAFLIHGERQKYVREFMDLYTEALAKYPEAEKLNFIGHSMGTYVFGEALKKYKTIEMNRVVLAGSVLPMDFKWDKLGEEGRVKGLRNFVGNKDWVVAIFPRLHELVKETFEIADSEFFDIGAAGFRGFTKIGNEVFKVGKKCEIPESSQESDDFKNVMWLDGGHGVVIDVENNNAKAIIDYILGKKENKNLRLISPCATKEKDWLNWLSKGCLLIWIFLFLILIGLGCFIKWLLFLFFKPLLEPSSEPLPKKFDLRFWGPYLLFILYILFAF